MPELTWDIAEGAVCVEAAKHEPDVIRGGCICGFGIWSAEHVAVMAFREVARHLRPEEAERPREFHVDWPTSGGDTL